ncbi:Alpha-ribazole phosphatase [Flavobacterium sp. 9AF]|uniref:alpha-ribazole phosphatase n=1 Tax=Flavobacterium sp. 9AF TaxID=2653142 RepID=UPI0012F2D6CC|nr:alpha-ribazole phosphatase [Flavobacterium sp. 9AF]VXC07233.1 Alpha-ribazole phosphatase [Flavobacterium sp. 9AF]
MEIYLVRHTETVCEKGICYGQADVALREPYLQEFEEIKQQLPLQEKITIFSSPLKRCTQLADFLSNDDFQTDARLMEMHFGDWELHSWDEIPKEPLNHWMEDFVSVRVPNGESFIILYERVLTFIEDLKRKNIKKALIITHAGVIRSFLCYQQNLPLQDAFQNKCNFGAVFKIILK